MIPKEALKLLSRYAPCPHEAWGPLGVGDSWARCLDCAAEFELGFQGIAKKRSEDFDLAISCLSDHLSLLQEIRDALGNGADEAAWPPGLTLPEAVARLRAMPAEVERWAHDSGVHARRMGEAQERARKARDEERADVVAWLREQGMAPYAQSNLDYAADTIERGDHRREVKP